MKKIIFKLTFLMMALPAFAAGAAAQQGDEADEETVQRFDLPSKDNKSFALEVIDAGEPISEPVKLNLTAYCSGGKKKEVKLLNRFGVCDYTKHTFNKEKNTLEIEYTVHTSKDGQITCSIPKTKSFNLKSVCK